MSYTTVKAIWPGEKHVDLQTLRNSHGSAPVIWDFFGQRYLGLKPHSWLSVTEKLWPLWKRQDIPEAYRAIFLLTFDRAYVIKKDYARMARDIRQFLQDHPGNPEYVNHWPMLAEFFESDPDYPAIGLHVNSVLDDPFSGPWNEEKEEYDQIDWTTAYDFYAELDGLKEETGVAK